MKFLREDKKILVSFLKGSGLLVVIVFLVFGASYENGIFSWRVPTLGFLNVHSSPFKKYARMGGAVFGGLCGEGKGYQYIEEQNSVVFAVNDKFGNYAFHVFDLNSKKDNVFLGDAIGAGAGLGMSDCVVRIFDVGKGKKRLLIYCGDEREKYDLDFERQSIESLNVAVLK